MNYSETARLILDRCFIDNGKLYKYLKSGKVAMVENKQNHSGGYCKFAIDSKIFYYHRAIWILTTGVDIPDGMQIDHIDGNKTNNVIENMRLVTNRQNGQNWERHRNGRLVGAKHHKKTNKWKSQIRIKTGEQIHLGTFNTELEAHNAYMKALKEL